MAARTASITHPRSKMTTRGNVKTKNREIRLERKVVEVCFHPTIVNLECPLCGAEFNRPALAEVLAGRVRRISRHSKVAHTPVSPPPLYTDWEVTVL